MGEDERWGFFGSTTMYYVYGHFTEDGKLYYIGKGTGNRAWSTNSQRRNLHWYRVYKKYGLVVKILEDNLTDSEARDREKKIIKEVGLENLTNILEGGEGWSSNDIKELWKDPTFRKKQIQERIQRWKDPTFRKNIYEKQKQAAHSPDAEKKRHQTMLCEICGWNVSKNNFKQHQSGNRCRAEWYGFSLKERKKLYKREKNRR